MDKNKSFYLTLVVVFCVVLSGLGGYFIGTHFSEKETVKNEVKKDEEKKKEEINANDIKVADLSNYVYTALYSYLKSGEKSLNSYLNNLSNDQKLYVAGLLNFEDEDNKYNNKKYSDLKNKLIEYERYQNVTNVFKELEEKRNEFFTKLPENLNEFVDTKEKLEGNMDVELLKNALIELNKRMSYQKPINTRITRKEISVEERKEYIREFISKRKNVKFTDLFEEYSKDVVVATFLSILDMCKTQEITLRQDSNFGEIYIERVNV